MSMSGYNKAMKGFNIGFGANTTMKNNQTKTPSDIAEAIYKSEAPTILVVSETDTEKAFIYVNALITLLGCRGQIDYRKPNGKVRDGSSLIGFVVPVLHDDVATAALALPGCVILSIEMLTTTPQTGVQSTVWHLRSIERERYRITYENSIQYRDFVVRFYTATNSEKMCNLKANSMSKILQALADEMWQKDTDGRAEIKLPKDFEVPPSWFKSNQEN